MFFKIARLDFFAADLFPGTCIDFDFMIFTEVLMKDLARMLIHVRKIFSCRVSFKMLGRNSEHSCDQVSFRMLLSKKSTITVAEVVLIQVSFLTVSSK